MLCPVQSRDNAGILLAYANRTLDPDTAAVLERHMESCTECRRAAEAQRAVWKALDEWESEEIAEDFDRRLYRRIEAEQDTGWHRLMRPFRPVSWKPAMSLAAAGVTLLAVFLLQAPNRMTAPGGRSESVEAEQVERSLDDIEMLRQIEVRGDRNL